MTKVDEDHRIQVTQEREFCSGILSVTTTFRLLVTGSADLTQLEKIIRILTVQKQILEEDAASIEATTSDAHGTATVRPER